MISFWQVAGRQSASVQRGWSVSCPITAACARRTRAPRDPASRRGVPLCHSRRLRIALRAAAPRPLAPRPLAPPPEPCVQPWASRGPWVPGPPPRSLSPGVWGERGRARLTRLWASGGLTFPPFRDGVAPGLSPLCVTHPPPPVRAGGAPPSRFRLFRWDSGVRALGPTGRVPGAYTEPDTGLGDGAERTVADQMSVSPQSCIDAVTSGGVHCEVGPLGVWRAAVPGWDEHLCEHPRQLPGTRTARRCPQPLTPDL